MDTQSIVYNRFFCTEPIAFKQLVIPLILTFFLISSSLIVAQPPNDAVFRPVLGVERILFIRLNYPDDPSVILTDEQALIHAENVAAIMEANSYGLLTFDIDITPILTMPQPKEFYELDSRLSFVRLRSDALKIAEEAGFVVDEYDREAIFSVKVWLLPFAGYGGVNNRTIYMKNGNAALTSHEFGHTFGWSHANFWQVSGSNPLDLNGTMDEYGDKFDIMGDWLNPHHFNPWYKLRASWLPSESVLTVPESGDYIIRGLELSPLAGSVNAYTALRIRRTPEMEFLVYYRSQEPFANVGALVSLLAPTNSSPTILLDMTPGSQIPSQNYVDAALVVGHTMHDDLTGIELTLMQKNDDSLLVKVIVPLEPIDILPKINFISPDFGMTIKGVVDYEITVFDPDVGNVNGAGIDTVYYTLGYLEGNNPNIDGGTEFIQIDSGHSTTPPYIFHVETDGFPDECYQLVVEAISQNGKKNKAILNHIIDNTGPSPVSSVEGMKTMDDQVKLEQNTPNPFYQSTTIDYHLKRSGQVTLSVYNLLGEKVQTLVQGHLHAGGHSVSWDGNNSSGKPMNNGLYLYELRAGEFVVTKMMILLR